MTSPDTPEVLAMLHRAIDELRSLTTNEEIFDFGLRWLKETTPAIIVGLAECDQAALVGRIVGVKGDRALLSIAEKLIRRPLVGSPIKVPHMLRTGQELNHALWGEHIHPIKEPFNLGVMFGLDSVYGYSIPFQDTTLVFGLVMKRGDLILPQQKLIVELVLKQISLALNQVSEPYPQAHAGHTDWDNSAAFYIENGVVIHCSGAVKALFGLEPDELMQRKFHAWLPREQADKVKGLAREVFHASTHEEKSLTIEVNISPMPGQNLTIEMLIRPLRLPAGKIVTQIIATDVTEKRQMEQALLESETRYRELFKTLTDGLAVTDREGYYIDCNPAFYRMLGYDSAEDIRGKNYLHLTPDEFHPLDFEQVKLLESRPYVEYEKEYLHKSGKRILIWLRLWKRLDPHGNFIGGWALIRDITTIRRMESDVGDIEKFRVLGELAAAISHEIRNPLTTVRGFLQLLPLRSGYSMEDRERFNLMINEIDMAATIIKDFLDLARPADPRKSVFSLNDLLASLLRVLESKAIILKVEMDYYLEEGLEVYGDPAQLRQVFLNLIQNAFQAMPEGGMLEVKAKRSGDSIVTHIIDTGVGIPTANLSRIGRPFFTTKVGGTGMGLTTCYRIVEAHSGRIVVSSHEGVGTTFSVYISPAPKEV